MGVSGPEVETGSKVRQTVWSPPTSPLTCPKCGTEGELLHGKVWNLVVMPGHKNSFGKVLS